MNSRGGRLVPILFPLLVGALDAHHASGEPAVSKRCAGAEYRRLDFWVGDSDAYEVGGAEKPVARARVEVILGGCALREVYEQTDGLVGESLSIYDASRRKWHQTWVTNRGQLLQIDGEFQGNRLAMQGRQVRPDGGEDAVRGVWSPEGDGVRETAQISSNGGATWRPLFDILFRRHR